MPMCRSQPDLVAVLPSSICPNRSSALNVLNGDSSTLSTVAFEAMSNSATSPVSIAGPPFDDLEADIVLRSTDNIDFYVHKILLSLVSPVFKTMFALPQSPPGDENNDAIFRSFDGRDLPIISLAENGELLRKLLTWCDPRCIPASTAPLDIDIVIRLADKYDMGVVISRARDTLMLKSESWSYTPPESMRAYAIACTHGFEDIARAAAKGVLRKSVKEIPSVPELNNITGTALQNLYHYHFACSRALSSLRHWRPADDLVSVMGNRLYCRCGSGPGVSPDRLSFQLKPWGDKYVENAIAALYERPCGDTVMSQSSVWVVDSVSGAPSCQKCSPIMHLTLERFGKALAAEVDKIIDNVPLRFDAQPVCNAWQPGHGLKS